MKYVVVIMDGAAEEGEAQGQTAGPQASATALAGATALSSAATPTLDRLCANARLYRLKAAHDNLPVDTLSCLLSLFGYNPTQYYGMGRAWYEAFALGIPLCPDDLVFRCNITRVTERGVLADSTAGMIDSARATAFLAKVPLPGPEWELFLGQSYRNVLVRRGAGHGLHDRALRLAHTLHCPLPHEMVGEAVAAPCATDAYGQRTADALARLMRESLRVHESALLSDAEVDSAHGAPGTLMLWPWSPSVYPGLPPFADIHGLRAAMVCGLAFVRGLGLAAGMSGPEVTGAEGSPLTNYAAKGQAAIEALAGHDIVFVHVNAADEASHLRQSDSKAEAVARCDSDILRPLAQYLEEHYGGEHALAVCIDHTTSCRTGRHGRTPTPCFMYVDGCSAQMPNKGGTRERFTEESVQNAPLLAGEAFLKTLFTCSQNTR